MEKIKGVNLGNWLMLEKWMDPGMFAGTNANDETWLNRLMDPEKLQKRMSEHRETYVTEEDFACLEKHGANLVRIPVPYFIFGDRPPFSGCIEYLDRAFAWAGRHGLKILIDLHTTPGGQNGYDNGGISNVCKWCQNPKEVEFVLTVLERLAKRYKDDPALYGIEVLNEPVSALVWYTSFTGPILGKARDPKEAKGSSYVPMKFLKQFYLTAYKRLRSILPPSAVIVFHDGFRLTKWNRFFDENGMKNVCLDTHIYIMSMETYVPFLHFFWVYRIYVAWCRRQIRKVSRHVPVVVGEWSLSNKYALRAGRRGTPKARDRMRCRFRKVADLELGAWSESAGYIFWNYELLRDKNAKVNAPWKAGFDLRGCWRRGWMPQRLD